MVEDLQADFEGWEDCLVFVGEVEMVDLKVGMEAALEDLAFFQELCCLKHLTALSLTLKLGHSALFIFFPLPLSSDQESSCRIFRTY